MANGSWTGIVGDLISGEIDISVATLTMTTEREEVGSNLRIYFFVLKSELGTAVFEYPAGFLALSNI